MANKFLSDKVLLLKSLQDLIETHIKEDPTDFRDSSIKNKKALRNLKYMDRALSKWIYEIEDKNKNSKELTHRHE